MSIIRTALDLTRHHARYVHGDLTVYLTWWLGDSEGPWPCMVIVPTYRQHGASYVPCVVSIDLAWIWSEEIGDAEFAAETAFDFAKTLGIGETPKNVIRVASIIRDHIDDLVKAPPRPPVQLHVVGDILITERASGKERHEEIHEDA